MADDIARLVADLKALPRTVDRGFRAALRKAADPIVADAKSRASWSDRIPDAIGVRTRASAKGITVTVRVDAKKAPHARPHEHKGKPGNFRHPVYADAKNKTRDEWTWVVAQRARPFLAPAAEAKADQAARQVMDVVEAAIRQHGWR